MNLHESLKIPSVFCSEMTESSRYRTLFVSLNSWIHPVQGRVPSEVASELTDLAQSTSENEWCWPLSSHETQLDSVLFNLGGGKKKVLFAPCFSFGWARENM